ncbi:hypothetical protein OG579_09105 [Williamsia herbipolensis]|uniref:Copper(I)-binding protein n=1 Tax=Williamsia herbipolensis TaxID=1603258 RepID=A0AAU4K7D0_9NOCA|nr:hypothetical protein [Williamsia herbipolensis]
MSVLTPAKVPARTPGRRAARAVAIAALGGALALGVSACGAGQIAQTANQQAAVNGSSATLGDIALRDVHIVFPSQGTQAFANGSPLEVAFLISNNSPYQDDKLESITLPGGGSVSFSGATDIPATKSLRAGQPSQLLVAAESSVTSASPTSPSAPDNNASDPSETRITVTVSGYGKQITPGLTVPMEFAFAKAGKTTVRVPIDAGSELQRRADQLLNPEPAEGGEG